MFEIPEGEDLNELTSSDDAAQSEGEVKEESISDFEEEELSSTELKDGDEVKNKKNNAEGAADEHLDTGPKILVGGGLGH